MEPINTISEWARPYFPQRLPSVEKIISTVQKEFDRRLTPSIKKALHISAYYKYEIIFTTICAALFIALKRKNVDRSNTNPLSEEELQIKVIEFKSKKFQTLHEAVAEANELKKQPLTTEMLLQQINEKLVITTNADDLFIKLRPKLTLSDINQDTLKLISPTPCTFCDYEFLSQFLDENFDPEISLNSEWLTQVLIAGTLKKQNFSGSHCRIEDLENYYRENGFRLPLYQPTPDGEADVFPPSDCHISANIPVEEYTNHLEAFLKENHSGLVITVRDRSIACARKNNKYYLFESHNPLTVEKPSVLTSKAFVLECDTIGEMGEFLSNHHYPPREGESEIPCRFVKLLPIANSEQVEIE